MTLKIIRKSVTSCDNFQLTTGDDRVNCMSEQVPLVLGPITYVIGPK